MKIYLCVGMLVMVLLLHSIARALFFYHRLRIGWVLHLDWIGYAMQRTHTHTTHHLPTSNSATNDRAMQPLHTQTQRNTHTLTLFSQIALQHIYIYIYSIHLYIYIAHNHAYTHMVRARSPKKVISKIK